MSRSQVILLSILTIVCLSGASCPRQVVPVGPLAPVVFQATPTLPQIIQVVNQNTQRVQQLEAVGASLSVPGAPTLRTSMALERPLRFRLQAGTGLTGSELDVGSNDEYFWFWARRAEPAIYYARHDQAHDPRVQRVIPISPHWLMEALGLIWLEPNRAYQGPYPRGPNQLELRYVESTPSGQMTKVLVVDSQRGQVNQVVAYNAAGQVVAAATSSNFQYDPTMLAWLPRSVEVELPAAQMSFTLSVDNYLINQLSAEPTQLWAMPSMPGVPAVSLIEAAL